MNDDSKKMTSVDFDNLVDLCLLFKKYPFWFNDWEKRFSKDLSGRFYEYKERTFLNSNQAIKLNSLVRKIRDKLEQEIIG